MSRENLKVCCACFAIGAIGCVFVAFLQGCGPNLPSASDEAAVGTYAGALAACEAKGKLAGDGGLGVYRECKVGIDKSWGVTALIDGGAQ